MKPEESDSQTRETRAAPEEGPKAQICRGEQHRDATLSEERFCEDKSSGKVVAAAIEKALHSKLNQHTDDPNSKEEAAKLTSKSAQPRPFAADPGEDYRRRVIKSRLSQFFSAAYPSPQEQRCERLKIVGSFSSDWDDAGSPSAESQLIEHTNKDAASAKVSLLDNVPASTQESFNTANPTCSSPSPPPNAAMCGPTQNQGISSIPAPYQPELRTPLFVEHKQVPSEPPLPAGLPSYLPPPAPIVSATQSPASAVENQQPALMKVVELPVMLSKEKLLEYKKKKAEKEAEKVAEKLLMPAAGNEVAPQSQESLDVDRQKRVNCLQKCTSCKFMSTDKAAFRRHMQTQHPQEGGPFFCSVCQVSAIDQESFQLHLEGRKHTRKARGDAIINNMNLVSRLVPGPKQISTVQAAGDPEQHRQTRWSLPPIKGESVRPELHLPQRLQGNAYDRLGYRLRGPLSIARIGHVVPAEAARGSGEEERAVFEGPTKEGVRARPRVRSRNKMSMRGATEDGSLVAIGSVTAAREELVKREKPPSIHVQKDNALAGTSIDAAASALEDLKSPTKAETGEVELPANLRDNLLCPLTKKIMRHPVLLSDGYTYEREAIKDYIRKHGRSPLTGMEVDKEQPLPLNRLVMQLKEGISGFK